MDSILISNGRQNMGEKELSVVNDLGVPGRITIQICHKTNKLLAAVSKIGQAGNKITFFDDDGEHRVTNKRTGAVTPMVEKDGTFKMNLWVWNPNPKINAVESTFRRQGGM